VKWRLWPLWQFVRRASSRIAVRMLAFNVLLVFLPFAGLLYLDTYEQHLLDAQERSMVQQGRLLAAALADRDPLDADTIDRLLRPLGQRIEARLRILDATGRVLGDTSRAGDQDESDTAGYDPRRGASSNGGESGYVDASAIGSGPERTGTAASGSGSGSERTAASGATTGASINRASGAADTSRGQAAPASNAQSDAPSNRGSAAASASRERYLYRVGSSVLLTLRQLKRDVTGFVFGARTRGTVQPPLDAGQIAQPASWPEVQAALAGRYGSETRLTRGGQRSVTLYSALPIRSVGPGSSGGKVTGVVIVSQSTYRLLQAIYDVRLRTFEVVMGSLLVAAVLTFVVAATIARPIRRLRRDAAELLDHRGRLTRRFQASARRDEIGDLGRALDELTRRLDEHLRFVEAFSADVSHEFKNPLASIRTIAEMLASVEDPTERERFLAMMRRDVDRLERLLSGVREIATIDAQLERETTMDVDVRAIVANVADAHRLRSQGRVTIAIDPPASPSSAASSHVRAAPERLAQVFDNLVDNAIGFSPDGGAVSIAIEKIDGDCRVSIRDEGPGIPPTHLTRIFERFFTYRPGTPDNRRHHTGLGLAIAKAIVESYGGTIAATPRDDHTGACLVVQLPLIQS
jgi:signal transduction histidine kinase